MPYRILSISAILGYGFPVSSLQESMKHKIHLIACDAGSMDAGPYYLGKGESYVAKEAVKRDFSLMLKAARQQSCPLILGNCGFCGNTAHVQFMLEIAKEVFVEQQIENTTVAVIDSHVPNQKVINVLNEFNPIGRMPAITAEDIEKSAIVAQMGIAPFITALDAGAEIILAGRACDVAVFAADPIRHGYDAGIAFHVGHILECGAIACDPGSGSDCLIAEFSDDKQSAIFIAPNKNRKTTKKSIAAHSLYEESHPSLQGYPEGVLSLEHTDYFQYTDTIAGIRNSVFVQRPISIKLEGSEKVGERYVAFIPAHADVPLDNHYRVYGKNAVAVTAIDGNEQEVGLLISVTGRESQKVHALASILEAAFLHYGYPGRKTTAGNMAYSLSPSVFSFVTEDNRYGSLILGGSRSPEFINQYQNITDDIRQRMLNDYPDLLVDCDFNIKLYGADNPLIFIDSVGADRNKALAHHKETLKKIEPYINKEDTTYGSIYAGNVYIWSLFHTTGNQDFINSLFAITLYKANGNQWQLQETMAPKQVSIGIEHYAGSIDPKTLDIIQPIAHQSPPVSEKRLVDMATIIRSKDAGVNTLTYDIFFNSEQDYQQALNSNIFSKENLAKLLNLQPKDIIGAYRANACQAIKVSRFRRVISGSPGARDVFGAQQQMPFQKLVIPIYAKEP